MTDATLRLLTAFVDDELTPDERAKAVDYLRRSAEARRLVRRLRADAALLRGLPAPALPTDVATATALRGEQVKAARAMARWRRQAWRSVGLAAASVVFGVCLGLAVLGQGG